MVPNGWLALSVVATHNASTVIMSRLVTHGWLELSVVATDNAATVIMSMAGLYLCVNHH